MKKLILLAVTIIFTGCSNDETPQTEPVQHQNQYVNENYNNLVFLDATFERLNSNGQQLPVSNTDAVTIFEKTTFIKVTPTTFETNTIAPASYFRTNDIFNIGTTQFSVYTAQRIIIKKIEYTTSYGKDRRSERYSY
jgi:PBP1b-binding outer membrane lipoprotein LpoB